MVIAFFFLNQQIKFRTGNTTMIIYNKNINLITEKLQITEIMNKKLLNV